MKPCFGLALPFAGPMVMRIIALTVTRLDSDLHPHSVGQATADIVIVGLSAFFGCD